MRISSMQMVGNYQRQLNLQYEKQMKIMEQTDGSSLHRPSDNAVNYGKYLRYSSSLSENNEYQSTVKNGISWMRNSDSAMVGIAEIMAGLKEKATNAANGGTLNESDMKDIAKEMLAKIQEIVSLSNTQTGDRYLFSGQADLTEPFRLTMETQDRGLSKTLADTNSQKLFFGVSQMLTMYGDDGNTYYLNTASGDVYDQAFMDEGFKNNIAKGQSTVASGDAFGNIGGALRVADHFSSEGVINSGTGTGTNYSATVNGVALKFTTVPQPIVTYNGDEKYISMVKKNGAQDKASATVQGADTVNATGHDLYGDDIFDNEASGNTYSGCAALNDLLSLYSKTNSADSHWVSSDGMTVADEAHSTMLRAETTIGSRRQAYEDVLSMLETQNTTVTQDVTDVSATDVAKLAVDLMAAQTVYNMSLSVGGRILPPSLADYL